MSDENRKQFARKLCSLYDVFDSPEFNITDFNTELMELFLKFGGDHNQRNRQTVSLIEYASAILNDPDESVYGLKVKGKDIFISLVLNKLETIPIPELVQERYPDLTEEEWQTMMRMAGLVLAAFEPSKAVE